MRRQRSKSISDTCLRQLNQVLLTDSLLDAYHPLLMSLAWELIILNWHANWSWPYPLGFEWNWLKPHPRCTWRPRVPFKLFGGFIGWRAYVLRFSRSPQALKSWFCKINSANGTSLHPSLQLAALTGHDFDNFIFRHAIDQGCTNSWILPTIWGHGEIYTTESEPQSKVKYESNLKLNIRHPCFSH